MQRTIQYSKPKKYAKPKTSNYSPILQGCMNTRSGREKFENFRILLDIGKSSTIVMGKLTQNLKSKETAENNWEDQGGNLETSEKVNIDF